MALPPSTAEHHVPGLMTGIALLLPITLSTMAIVLLSPILPQLMAEFKTSPHADYLVPLVLTTPAICIALFSPLAGMLGDYFGRRTILLWSFVGYALVGIAPVFLHDLASILASRIAVGLFEAVIMVLTTAMIGDYFSGPARDKWLAAQAATASLSALLFFNIGGQLGALGWRAPFWIYTSALLMMALVLRFTWEPAENDTAQTAGDAPHHASWGAFPLVRFAPVLIFTVYTSVFFYTVQIQASVGLARLGMQNPATIGFYTSLASIGVPLGTFVYSRSGVTNPFKLLLVEMVMLSTGFLIMSQSQSPTPFLLGCFINQLGAGMLLPTLLVWAMSMLSFEVRSRGAGLWQGALAVGQFVCPVTGTYLANSLGGLFPAFGALALCASLAGLVALLVLLRRRVRQE